METYGEDFADEHRFQLPEDCHWQNVRETPANVGAALQNALRGIEAANQKHLYGVFGDAQWTNKDRLPDALLKDLIEHFSALRLGNQNASVPGEPRIRPAAIVADADGSNGVDYERRRLSSR